MRSIHILGAVAALAFSIFSGLASAVEAPSSSASGDLANAVFFLNANAFRLDVNGFSTLHKTTETSNSIGDLNTGKVSSQSFGAELSYGVSDRVTARVGVTDLTKNKSDSTKVSNGFVTSSESKGISDPTLGLNYRFAKGTEEQFYGDIVLDVNPSFGPHKAAIGTAGKEQTGDNRSGAWTAAVGVPMYWVRGMNELEIEPRLVRTFKGHDEGTTLGTTESQDAYWRGALNLADRLHFGANFYAEPAVSLHLPSSFDSTDGNDSVVSRKAKFYSNEQLNFGYLMTPQSLINLALNYASFKNTSQPGTALERDVTTKQVTAELTVSLLF